MLTLADLARLRTTVATQVQPVARAALSALRDVALGEQVPAQVAEALPGKLYRVMIENQSFTLRLPIDARPGEIVQLTVSAREPSLKFELAPPPSTPGADARLSDTARVIASLLVDTEAAPPAAARVTVPLLAGPPANTGDVAAELKRALAHSGIFYESHQAQWVAGERPLAHLLQEPQALLPPLRGGDVAQSAATAQAASDAAQASPRAAEGPVHREASAIVRQQLDTLATQHVTWHGQIWPGQALLWEIAEQERPGHAEAQPREWSTRLQLALPQLGEVTATLSFTGRGVAVRLATRDAAAGSTLAASGGTLQRSLSDAGLDPVTVAVNGDAKI